MSYLDCTDLKTTIHSICRIVELEPDELSSRLQSIRVESLPDAEKVVTALGDFNTLPNPEYVCWFHATRVLDSTTFKDGLKPTSTMKKQIEVVLRDLAFEAGLCSKDDWEDLPRSDSYAGRLAWKAGIKPFDDGPHGFLVRETILHPDNLSIANYCDAPEIVREICWSIPKNIGHPLLDAYKTKTRPAIVNFRSRLQIRGPLETAANYVHAKLVDGTLSDRCTRGFDGRGTPIDGHDILNVEFL